MSERTVTVASRSGLHARPAALFVKAAAAQPVRVKLRVGDGPTADARSILAVLALRVEHGTTVTLIAPDEGADGGDADAAERALDTLADLLARDLDAEPAEPKPAEAKPAQAETVDG
jgi:phosphocarrier protein HPr